ncbi:TPA: phage tail assembly chaperone [Burkholderia vietnamiensis]|nr:phage tail assembly chaperone [Burkholderia vietnamiensis]
MVIALQMMYPELVPGRDYRCCVPIGGDGNQCGDPRIGIWRAEIERPSDDDVHAFFAENEGAIRETHVRIFRNLDLAATDGKANVPVDAPASVQALHADWAAYRQALRDVPQQEGFPFSVEWPVSPHAAAMTNGDGGAAISGVEVQAA